VTTRTPVRGDTREAGHYQNGRHRLTTPLRRRADGSFEEIGWDTAIAEVTARWASILIATEACRRRMG
jgi:anaerobic selenocysteine-containing dehydrogenase